MAQKHRPTPRMIDRTCAGCKQPFKARAADAKRGWGRFCSKRCKAIKQEARTGLHKAQLARMRHRADSDYEDQSGVVESVRNPITGAWLDGK